MKTPEQWKLAHDIVYVDDTLMGGQMGSQHFEVCEVNRKQPGWEARAALIAAAPDLLEAAREVEATIQGLALDVWMKAATDKLYKALAKAEGKT